MTNENNKNKFDLPCEIVRDLLPLYHDNVVNDTTKTAVENHLTGCANCTKEYETICSELNITPKGKNPSKFKKAFKKLKKRSFIKGTVITAAICGVIIGGYIFLTKANIKEVPADDIKIDYCTGYDISKMTDEYNSDEEQGIFFYYTIPKKYAEHTPEISQKFVGNELQLSMKYPIIDDEKNSEIKNELNQWETVTVDKKQAQSIEKVTVNGKIIWQKKDGFSTESSEFAEENLKFIYSSDDFAHASSMTINNKIVTFMYDSDNTVKVFKTTGELIFKGSIDEWYDK